MTKEVEEKVREICEKNIKIIGESLSKAIGNAIADGYQLGWLECMKTFGINVSNKATEGVE